MESSKFEENYKMLAEYLKNLKVVSYSKIVSMLNEEESNHYISFYQDYDAYNDKYYNYSYGNDFEGINADCSNFTSSDYHYVCFPNYYLNSSQSYCEYGTHNKCGTLENPK